LIQGIMESEGMSQNRIAKRTGLNQGRISSIDNGKKPPTKKEKKTLEQLFQLPMEILLEEVDEHGKVLINCVTGEILETSANEPHSNKSSQKKTSISLLMH